MADTPPLQAVKVFDAVARHLNFTKAAAELNMTQSAVSYQVKLLEDYVGTALFRREARGVGLSEHGRAVAPLVRQALGDLAQAFRSAKAETANLLVISTMHTFATTWLAPRIGSFQMENPELAVRLDISPNLANFHDDGVDVGIRSGKGEWPGIKSHCIGGGNFTVACSPQYYARIGKPKTPADLADCIFIGPRDDWWPLWFAAAGINPPAAFSRPGIDVETQQMAMVLAVAGHGLALVHLGFVTEEFKTGKLIQPFDVMASSGFNYYLVYPEGGPLPNKTKLFRDWILKEAGQELA
ncbi:LysR family transcriptional regulator [Nordella sp. HKS 07]|uniref:LysR substrate-binding domain-containing protein n=1 Tax=Nordella sp. HKS 07 TaxID=2712222 RepID=UPI0013E114CA|nr:LysR substrate-binding domain-containing protein [Nordella sp. HKS 07]QIG48500.1 LysR family transcriptional regulator [Nordella sp. HKS 07]